MQHLAKGNREKDYYLILSTHGYIVYYPIINIVNLKSLWPHLTNIVTAMWSGYVDDCDI